MPPCNCSSDQFSASLLWSLNVRDRYCPWCGGQVRGLTSSSFIEDERGSQCLVLYLPEDQITSDQFEFRTPISLEYHDNRHELQLETTSLSVSAALGHTQNRDVQINCTVDSGSGVAVLVLQAVFRATPGSKTIPESGISVDVRIQGDFPDIKWNVLLCRPPRLNCRLEGTGVRPRLKSGTDADWEITRYVMLSLSLQVEVTEAPVYVSQRAHRDTGVGQSTASVRYKVQVDDGEQVKIEEEFLGQFVTFGRKSLFHVEPLLRPGQRLNPKISTSIPIQLNCAEFKSGWQVYIDIEIDSAGDPRRTLTHKLVCLCVDIGNIQFSPPQLNLPRMFAGERRSNAIDEPITNPEGAASDAIQKKWRLKPVVDRVKVRNEGASIVTLRPEIEEGGDWIRVGWDTESSISDKRIDSTDSKKLTLASKDSCNLLVELDFRRREPSNQPLRSRIVLLDATPGGDQRVVLDELTVSIQRTDAKSLATSPLFLDFGNSNTSATVIVQEGAREVVRPGHHFDNTEHFPTVLLLNRIAPDDLPNTDCLIGTFAVDLDSRSRGPDNSSRLITSLKQHLCALPEDHFELKIPCKDQYNLDCFLTAPALLQLFLQELVRRAETLLRGKLITKLVISYPARLSPKQRKAYLGAFESACDAISQTPERVRRAAPLQFLSDIKVDEANAVALGFAYSQDPSDIRKIDTALKRPGKRMRVAAVDLGGGSLDIACIDFENSSLLPTQRRLKSSYVWIGGDVHFGGNNLTTAAFEILRMRLDQQISQMSEKESSSAESPSLPVSKDVLLRRLRDLPYVDEHFHGRSADKATVFTSLWDAAELIKLSALEEGSNRNDNRLLSLIASALRVESANLSTLKLQPLWLDAADIETHQVERDQHGQGEYSVCDRFAQAIEELRIQLTKEKEKEIDFIVISGGASQWAFLREEIQRKFLGTAIEYVPERLKSRVAEGLALAWSALSSKESHPACSGNCTTATIAAIPPLDSRPVTLFPVCTPFHTDNEGWRELQSSDALELNSVTLLKELRRPMGTDVDKEWEVALCRLVTEDGEPLGRFVATKGSSPPPVSEWQRVDIRFAKDEDSLELRIITKDSRRPHWQTQLTSD